MGILDYAVISRRALLNQVQIAERLYGLDAEVHSEDEVDSEAAELYSDNTDEYSFSRKIKIVPGQTFHGNTLESFLSIVDKVEEEFEFYTSGEVNSGDKVFVTTNDGKRFTLKVKKDANWQAESNISYRYIGKIV